MNTSLKTAFSLTALLMASATQAASVGHFLLGVDGGYAWRSGTPYIISSTYPTAAEPVKLYTPSSVKDDGGIVGVFGGFQWHNGPWVAGVEINVGWQDFGSSHAVAGVVFAPGTGNLPYSGNVEMEREWVASGSVRLAYKMMDRVSPYVRLGAEASNDKLSIDTPVTNIGPVSTFDTTRFSNRLIAGAGVEVDIIEKLTGRVEYLYSTPDGPFSYVVPTPNTGGFAAFVHHQPNQHAVKVAAVWNFV